MFKKEQISTSEIKQTVKCALRVFDSEMERVRASFPIEETVLLTQSAEIKSNILKIVFSETVLTNDFFSTLLKILDKKINLRFQKQFQLNQEASSTNNQILARELGMEFGLSIINEPNKPYEPLFVLFRKLEKIIQKFFSLAIGFNKANICVENLIPDLFQTLQTHQEINLRDFEDKIHQHMIVASQVKGKYEASQEMLVKQRELTQQVLVESKLSKEQAADLYEKRITHLQQLLEKQGQRDQNGTNVDQMIRRFSDVVATNGQAEALQVVLKSIEELRDEHAKNRRLFETQIDENNRVSKDNKLWEAKLTHKNELEQFQLDHEQQIKALRLEHQEEISHLNQRILKYERIDFEVKNSLNKRENEVKMLQEKIKAEENLKATQIQFSSLVCNVT